MLLDRVYQHGKRDITDGPIIYWMNRDCRIDDNWALLFAQEIAEKNSTTLRIVYNLDPCFLGGGARQLSFKIEGLQEVESRARELNIPFDIVVETDTADCVSNYIQKHKAGAVITDFSPLRIQKQWIKDVHEKTTAPLYVVDTHNIVPCWKASNKTEFAAYTIRPKIHTLLPTYMDVFPEVRPQDIQEVEKNIDWKAIYKQCDTREDVEPVTWIHGGAKEAKKMLTSFIEERVEHYEERNDPNVSALSDLSPFLHYGHISPQRVAMCIQESDIPKIVKDSFLEELIVRRELADNFCHYNTHYDSFEGFHPWAQKTLLEHRDDPRAYTYSQEEFEHAKTHDPLWNAAQMEMVKRGKMHGYMRMYWAKKLLEWTTSPEEALRIGIYLNDTYELDGRDPNGYVGLAWSIGGVHDRAWGEREIFGKIRYMNAKGCARKFDTKAYIASIEEL